MNSTFSPSLPKTERCAAKRRTMPGPKLPPLWLFRQDIIGTMTRLVREYGDCVQVNIFGRSMYLVNHPDLVREVLVSQASNFVKGNGMQHAKRIILGNGLLTSEGETHREQRQRVQPLFQRQRVLRHGPATVESALRLSERWAAKAPMGPVEVMKEMMRLMLGVMSQTTFGVDLDVEAGTQTIASALITLSEWLFVVTVLPQARFIEKLPFGPGRRVRAAREALEAMIYRMIAERRATGPRADVLSMLMEENAGLSDTQIRDQAMVIFLASVESLANMLTWTWYTLSQNPEAEARLQAELATVLGDRPPTVADLDKLTYTRMVLAETMRLYPPAWKLDRRVVNDCELGGYAVKAGAHVWFSPWLMHHDARYYPDPERFDPERWTPEAQAARPKFAYFPFGGGARVCIGEHLAWMQGTLIVATLAQRWQLRLAPGHQVELRQRINLRPKDGLPMTLQAR